MSKLSDENYTPNTPEQPVIDQVLAVLGIIDLDPCSPTVPTVPAQKYYTLEEDCLKQKWEGRVFLNPPFSKPAPFLQKLCDGLVSGDIPEAIALLKAGTQANQKTGKLISDYASSVCQWGAGKSSRLGFLNADGEQRKGADFDCILVYFGPSWRLFEFHFRNYGHVMACQRTIRLLLGTELSTVTHFGVKTNA